MKGATSVSGALAIAQQEPLDLVISDLGLPDGTGLDLMRELRTRHGLRGICLSGYGMEEDLERSAEAGFIEHLTKPVDLGQAAKGDRQRRPQRRMSRVCLERLGRLHNPDVGGIDLHRRSAKVVKFDGAVGE